VPGWGRFLLLLICLFNALGLLPGTLRAQSRAPLYDDPRWTRWVSDFVDGRREDALRLVEADLISAEAQRKMIVHSDPQSRNPAAWAGYVPFGKP
jgi:hypothetical protein